MSYSTLYKVYKTRAVEITEYRNSHGTAPPLWSWLTSKFLSQNQVDCYYNCLPGSHWGSGDLRPLWDLARNPRVPYHFRICHAFTFDYACCPPEKVKLLANCCDLVDEEISKWPFWANSVNHWGRISETLSVLKLDKRCMGVSLDGTSVSNIWTDEYRRRSRKESLPWDCIKYVPKDLPVPKAEQVESS